MDVEVVNGGELTPRLEAAWERVRESDPAYRSPYFSSHFTVAAAAVLDDVRIAVVSQGGRELGFFPFQHQGRALARPVAHGVNDVQGVIAAPELEWDARGLLAACDLPGWRFDHLLGGQSQFRAFHRRLWRAPYIDLSAGLEAYLEERRARGSNAWPRIAAKARRLEREVGPVRFVHHEPDPELLDRLRRWKILQYQGTGQRNRWTRTWVTELVARLHRTRTAELRGVLSALYAGDRLVAAHMGLRSRGVWHYWLPAYRAKFSRYSPGLVLLREMIRHAPKLGVSTIDLGAGEQLYKLRLASGARELAQGAVELA